MSLKRKIIVTILLLLILIAPIIYYFSERDINIFTPPQPQEQTPIPIPIISEEVSEQDYKIEISVQEEEFQFPAEISLIEYEKSEVSEAELQVIANSFRFTEEPKISDDYFDGTIVTYSNDIAYMTSSIELGTIDYALHQFPEVDTILEEDDIIENAKAFLEFSQLTNTDETIVTGVDYYRIAVVGDRLERSSQQNADVYQVNFSPNISEYPILTVNPRNTLNYVQMMKDGVIFSAHIQRYKSIETTEKRVLKSYLEVVESLEDAAIVSVNNGTMFNESIPNNVIKEIKVDSITLAYLQTSPADRTIQPIFLLKGVASLPSIESDLPVTLYLPAIK